MIRNLKKQSQKKNKYYEQFDTISEDSKSYYQKNLQNMLSQQ